MDPDPSTMENRSALECLVWGGFWAAASDGRIDQAGLEALARAVKPPFVNVAAATVRMSAEPLKPIREQFNRAAQGCRQLPPSERHALIQQLIAFTRANLAVTTQEKSTLQEICTVLKVDPIVSEEILSQHEVNCVVASMR